MNKELHKEIEEISPLLANIPKEDLSAPVGYFDTFSSRMLDRVKEEHLTAPTTKVLSIYQYTKYLAAAVVLIFMGLSILLIKQNHQSSVNMNIDQSINTEDIYLSELDEASIIEYSSQTIDNKSNIDIYQDYIDEETLIEEIN